MKGIYCLILEVKKDVKVVIGALGKKSFRKGNYIYIGSALNNLEKRIQRHLRKEKKIHWHIDYLTTNKEFKIIKTFFKQTSKKEECNIAKKVSEKGIPINSFGCSDCKCQSHLYKVKFYEFINDFMKTF